ncbi:MAG: chemotaxis protein CheW [Planctomycetia bacterium]|nr:chemotaxis protein CheW [Planctomycetia bacterium]
MNGTERDHAIDSLPSAAKFAVNLAELIAQSTKPTAGDTRGSAVGVPQPGTVNNRNKHVVFVLNATHYAVPLANVLEIQRVPQITALPHVPDWLRGVTNMRGDVLSVVDLRMLLKIELAECSQDERMVVVKSTKEELAIGWIVDRVVGIRGIEPSELKSTSLLPADSMASFIAGIIQRDDRLIAVLDVNRVLSSPELRQFELAS